MGIKTAATPQVAQDLPKIAKLLDQYGCGPVRFSGTSDALYERHLLFDSVIDLTAATARDQFEALARSVRDILSQRWLATEKTYERQNPKRLYYLSMEFLIGRSLANNVTNLLLDPLRRQVIQEKNVNWIDILEQEPDAGLGNGGLGRLAACFIESAATMQLPAMGYGLRYEYGIFKQSIQDGWQQERARQLAPLAGPLGSSSSQRKSRNRSELFVRTQRREFARRTRTSVDSDWHPV